MNLNNIAQSLSNSKALLEASLDQPQPAKVVYGTVLVSGWAFSQSEKVNQVEAWLDKVYLGKLDYGLPRPDVALAHKGQAPCHCGYRSILDFNPLVVGIGEKILRVVVTNASGNRQELKVSVQVQLPGLGPTVAAYHHWLKQIEPDYLVLKGQQEDFARLTQTPGFRISVPISSETTPAILQNTLDSLLNQTYQAWEFWLILNNPHQLEQWSKFAQQDKRIRLTQNNNQPEKSLGDSTADFLVLLKPGDQLAPPALFRLYSWLHQNPDAVAVYTDEDNLNEVGERYAPFFKPDWSPEYLRQVDYTGDFLVVRSSVASLTESPGLGVDFRLRLAEQPQTQVGHISEVLYHRAASVPLQVEAAKDEVKVTNRGLNQPKVAVRPNSSLPRRRYPQISILLRPGKLEFEQFEMEKYFDKLFELTNYPDFELLFLQSGPGLSLPTFSVPSQQLRFDARAGLSSIFNQANTRAKGEYLLLLDGLSQPLNGDWLENLLFYAEQPDVGAVGGLGMTSQNTVAEAGLRLSSSEGVLPLLRGYPAGSEGYGAALLAAREVSALSCQGLMLKKSLVAQSGGFNPLFDYGYAGVDFCLRLRRAGFRLIFTPEATLLQPGPSWLDDSAANLDKMLLLDIWQDWFEQPDPFYNPNFDQNYYDYRI